MKPEDFFNMLPKDFWYKLEGFYNKISREQRYEWERIRWQTTLLLNVHTDKGKTLKATDLIEFSWDKKESKKELKTNKEYAEYVKKLEDTKLKKKKNVE